MKNARGFSLIELLIVVAIILIIAAIAIPNMLQARISANESSAAGSLRAVTSAEITYFNSYPTIGYSPNLLSLGGPLGAPCTASSTSACILDSLVSNATPGSSGKSGYQFQATGLNGGGSVNVNYVIGATPLTVGFTGNRNFCSTDEQILRVQYGVGGAPVTTIAACIAYPVAP